VIPLKPVSVGDAVLLATLTVSVVTDLRSGRIPNLVTYPAILLGIAAHSRAVAPSVRRPSSDALSAASVFTCCLRCDGWVAAT